MSNDSQILKGLILLLEDMQLNVTSVSNYHELENLNFPNDDCPDLLIFPYLFVDGNLGYELVKKLRVYFKQRIPAILLNQENGITYTNFTDENIMVLSDCIKPKDLRQNITTVLTV